MSTIKVQIPVSPETIEREVQLPAYRRSGSKFIKVISEDEVVDVFYSDTSGAYSLSKWNHGGIRALSDRNLRDCSKEEFENAFEQVLDRLSNLQITHA